MRRGAVASDSRARHYYDIHQLLASTEVRAGIAEVGIGALARDVCTYSAGAGLPFERRPRGRFSTSPASDAARHLAATRREFEERVLRQLLWPSARQPSFDDCIAAVHLHGAIV